MRIVCQKCAAAYAIDDRLVRPKGVRAQCPRCRHLQIVRREEQPASVVPPPAQSPIAPPPSAPSTTDEISRPDPEPAPAHCRQCGKEIDDPFDAAVGVCSECRARQDAGSPGAESGPTTPFATEESLGRTNEPVSEPSAPVASSLPPQTGRAEHEDDDEADEDSASKPRRRRMLVFALAGVALVAAVGIALALTRPWVDRPPPLATKRSAERATPIDGVIARWRLQFPDVSGDADDLIKEGESKLALDTTTGYVEAEEAFQKALVLDGAEPRAIAGYALALALGKGRRIDPSSYRDAMALVAWAEDRSNEPLLFVAHASLLLTQADANPTDARALADRATSSEDARVRALAFLTVGQTHLSTNAHWAAEAFDKAVEADAGLRRGYLLRARAYEAIGEVGKAVENLEKRLELDADQWEAAESLARLYAELGELERAQATLKRVGEAIGRNPVPTVAAAVLAYQHAGRVDEAIASLEALADRGKHDEAIVVEALGHLAAARRLSGKGDRAAEAANQALAIAPDDVNAHLQLLLLALDRNDAAQAAVHLPKLSGRLGDAAVEKLLEGRVYLAEGKPEEALAAFLEAVKLDENRVDALLLAGAAAARLGRAEEAFKLVLQRAANADPTRHGPRPAMARYFLQRRDTLDGAARQFFRLGQGKEDPNGPLCEALVQWHLGEYRAAEASLKRVLAIDPANAHGYAFRALLSAKRGETRAAVSFGQKAVDANRELGLTHYALGVALLASGQRAKAESAFRVAVEKAPGLLAARVQLGAIELATGRADDGRRRLRTVLDRDPLYFDAKRALYRADGRKP